MIISTERLIIRPFCIEHLSEFYSILQDETIATYLPGVYSSDIDEIRENIKIYQKGDFVNDFYCEIVDKQSEKIIGAIICVRTIHNMYDISYFITKEFRRKGYMYEALSCFLNKIRSIKRGANIWFFVKKENVGSIRLLQKMEIKPVYADMNCLKFMY